MLHAAHPPARLRPPTPQALEARQREAHSGEEAPAPRLSTQQLYNTVNAQMAVVQAQVRGRRSGAADLPAWAAWAPSLPPALAEPSRLSAPCVAAPFAQTERLEELTEQFEMLGLLADVDVDLGAARPLVGGRWFRVGAVRVRAS